MDSNKHPVLGIPPFLTYLLSNGFIVSSSNSSLFIQHTATTMIVLLVYVDDILVTGNDSAHNASFITHMHKAFFMKELGLVNYFLGVSVSQSTSRYFLSQTKYALEILAKAGISDCKSSPSPISVKPSSLSSTTVPFSNPSLYCSVVGAL
ncbi:uncharacterized protein LOC114286093 [Camellia sinensis]|uniref:uncharacterized protein LOC114286093 n=1 Tax=Camellia sinensis TaxID=4442 RepID=UPI0010358707|nr:uncharacterized protein LOC114286093 [Camellia sinensis]